MKKHAYLIIAYDKFDQLAFQVSLLDDPRNDIYIHIDKRSALSDTTIAQIQNTAKHSKVYFVPRMAVYWGHFSLVECELLLYQTASNQEEYAFYHLLSGADFPLRSQDYIHDFFQQHADKTFIARFNEQQAEDLKLYKLVEHYHFFRKITPRNLAPLPRKILRAYQILENKVQTFLHIDRLHGKRKEMGFDGYSQWKSINHRVLKGILSERKFINKHFHHTFCSDEYYFGMTLKKAGLLDTIYHYPAVNDIPDELQGNLRYINWWDGHPYEWTDSPEDKAQLEKGIALGHLFSRKFDLNKYPGLKDFIQEKVKEA
ncbi:hypothetical protein HO675_03925 [Streptococcus suis]|nr:hypothetical protein [Streptococcus suis]